MKKTISTCVFALATLLSGAAASGSEATRGVVFHAPFDFVVGSAKLSSGDYYVVQQDSQSLVFVTNLKTRRSFAVMPEANYIGSLDAQPGVSFVKVGDQYFMKLVRVNGGQGFQMRLAR